ncbi:MAG: hercynine metabolism protein [Cyanobacteriota bacterium]|nr:hercynine metabolism protein [Cyanobacteriota bacterium]
MSSGTWLDELEARLDATLQSFLRSNPAQESLLAEQEARDRQQALRRARLDLRQEAELQRQGLLRLAAEIRQWQERVERARAAGAQDLVRRAGEHVATLMEQGRSRWQTLGELGDRFARVERELAELTATPPPPPAAPAEEQGDDLQRDWARFEAEQELEELRRQLRR